jgi:hypothetical protein
VRKQLRDSEALESCSPLPLPLVGPHFPLFSAERTHGLAGRHVSEEAEGKLDFAHEAGILLAAVLSPIPDAQVELGGWVDVAKEAPANSGVGRWAICPWAGTALRLPWPTACDSQVEGFVPDRREGALRRLGEVPLLATLDEHKGVWHAKEIRLAKANSGNNCGHAVPKQVRASTCQAEPTGARRMAAPSWAEEDGNAMRGGGKRRRGTRRWLPVTDTFIGMDPPTI